MLAGGRDPAQVGRGRLRRLGDGPRSQASRRGRHRVPRLVPGPLRVSRKTIPVDFSNKYYQK